MAPDRLLGRPGLAAGEVAVRVGLVPSLLSSGVTHGLTIIEALGIVIVVRMIGAVSAQKEHAESALRDREADFRYQAGHDALTGLANRKLLVNRLDDALGGRRSIRRTR